MKIHFLSLGCSKNQVDSEQVIGLLLDRFPNTILTSSMKDADIVFVNTCGFLKSARDESLSAIQQSYPTKTIILGCLTPFLAQNILKKYPHVMAVVRQGHYTKISTIVQNLQKKYFLTTTPVAPLETSLQSRYVSPVPYAYIKIAEGCNSHCSYCLIPAIRGKYRSKPMQTIIQEAMLLQKSGVKEIILIAQDTSSYGTDLYKKLMLPLLLQKLCNVKGIRWIRLLYTYPDRITDHLIDVMAQNKKIIPYLDIPFQHADPEILRAMKRPHDIKKWGKMIALIRQKIPSICLRTTFIVGFPGEKEQHVETLKCFMTDIGFDRVGFFSYSREKGTPSYHLPYQVPVKTKQQRLRDLMTLQLQISLQKNKTFIGKTLTVMIEGYDRKKKLYWGRSYRDAPDIDGKVYFDGDIPSSGAFVTVRINRANATDLWGKSLLRGEK